MIDEKLKQNKIKLNIKEKQKILYHKYINIY